MLAADGADDLGDVRSGELVRPEVCDDRLQQADAAVIHLERLGLYLVLLSRLERGTY